MSYNPIKCVTKSQPSLQYRVLESMEFMDKNYQYIKQHKLTEIVGSILAEQKKPFTCFITALAKMVQEGDHFKMGIVAVKHNLKVQLQGNQNEGELQRKMKSVLGEVVYWMANCMGASIDLTPATLGNSSY